MHLFHRIPHASEWINADIDNSATHTHTQTTTKQMKWKIPSFMWKVNFLWKKKCLTANLFRHRIFFEPHIISLLLQFGLACVTLTLIHSHLKPLVFERVAFFSLSLIFYFSYSRHRSLSMLVIFWTVYNLFVNFHYERDGSFRFYFPKRELCTYLFTRYSQFDVIISLSFS